jgi:hypothetical protein
LRQYGQIQPPVGLEGRILANLQSVDARPSGILRWWPALAAVAAMLLIGAAILIGREHRRNEVVKAPVLHAPQNLPEVTQARNAAVIPQTSKRRPMTEQKQPTQEKNAIEPRPEQFPSPRPLSEQEQLLADYVRERPREAGLVARARQQLLQQALLEMEKQNHVPKHSQEFEQ